MPELKFANTKWDARTWTQEQKIQWQEKAFKLGYTLCASTKPDLHPLWNFFFLEDDKTITLTSSYDVSYLARESTLNFEDMFTEEAGTLAPEVETKHSVFTHPRWVTASTTLQADGGLGTTSITEGKDYKVIDINFCNKKIYQYSLRNDEGVIELYHVSHFYEVTPEGCTYLPSVEPEDEGGNDFENVYYKEPNIPRLNYWYITLKSLSQEQIDYIGENFRTDGRWSFKETENILMYQVGNYDGEYVWTNILDRCNIECMHEVSFNDIFKEVN